MVPDATYLEILDVMAINVICGLQRIDLALFGQFDNLRGATAVNCGLSATWQSEDARYDHMGICSLNRKHRSYRNKRSIQKISLVRYDNSVVAAEVFFSIR